MSATADQRRQALGYWEANAAPWDTTIGPGGNNYWKRLQKPCLERLLADHFQAKDRPHRALELACGNGLCSRWLASHSDAVGEVLATDGSRAMLDRARSHGSMDGKISFRELDVTNVDDFTRLLEEGAGIPKADFDIIIMNMALMDVCDLEPVASALPKLLSKDGVFVATLLHPVFMTSNYTRDIQYAFDSATGEERLVRSKAIHEYLDVAPAKQFALAGRSAPCMSFHRPIHELLAPFFKAGLVMDAMEEPSFDGEDADPERPQATTNFTQLPAHLAFRLRRLA
ncbi:hypothetical protein ACO1O0_004666 [Amphichorda felina]